jgi:hypothetical protein
MSKYKVILSSTEAEKADKAVANDKYEALSGKEESFETKKDYSGKKILMYSLFFVDIKGNAVLFQRKSDEENNDTKILEPRITDGYSLFISGNSHKEAFSKIINIPKSIKFKYKFLLKNGDYYFDIRGGVTELPEDLKYITSISKDKELITQKNRVIKLLTGKVKGKEKLMEIALYNRIIKGL